MSTEGFSFVIEYIVDMVWIRYVLGEKVLRSDKCNVVKILVCVLYDFHGCYVYYRN